MLAEDDLSEEEVELIVAKVEDLREAIHIKNLHLKETQDRLRLEAMKEIAVIKRRLLNEAISLGCNVSEQDTKETIRKAIYFAKKNN